VVIDRRKPHGPGWELVKFGDVVRLCGDRCPNPALAGIERYVGLEHLEPGNLQIRSWGLVSEGVTFTNRFKPGQVLFGKRRSYQRKVAVADFEGVCSGDIYVFEPASTRLHHMLLPYVCQTDMFFDHALKTSAGSLSPRTNWSSLAALEFELPPNSAQPAIAKALSASEDVAAEYGLAVIAADTALTGLREQLCGHLEGKIDSRLDGLCTMQNGRPFAGEEYGDSGVRLLRPGNLGPHGSFVWEAEKTVHVPGNWAEDAATFVVHRGDVVINLTAQSLEDGFMGRVCFASNDDECLLNQRIGRFHCDTSRILPEYLFRCLQTRRFQQHAIINCEGSKVKHLFWSHLAKYRISVPPLLEQERRIAMCSALDSAVGELRTRSGVARRQHAERVNQLLGGAN